VQGKNVQPTWYDIQTIACAQTKEYLNRKIWKNSIKSKSPNKQSSGKDLCNSFKLQFKGEGMMNVENRKNKKIK